MQALVESESAVNEPVFVVGAERSGSTMLKLMLDHHPAISFPHQYEFSVDRLGDDGTPPDLPAYWAYLEGDGVFRRSGFSIDRSLDYHSLQDHFLDERRRGRPVVGGTLHRHFSRLLHLWPETRFVHLVRDPRAVARSVVEMGWAGHVYEGAGRWVEAEREWERVCARVPPSRRHEVRYEDLVTDPERVLRGVCEFLGVPYDPAMLRYPRDSTYDAPDPQLLGRWRTHLSAREQGLVDGRVGALLGARGYPPSAGGPLHPGGPERVLLALLERVGRARFSVGRLGLALFVSHWLARKLRIEPWRRATSRRVQAIAERHIR